MREWEPVPHVCKYKQSYNCCHVRVTRARLERDGHVPSTWQKKKIEKEGDERMFYFFMLRETLYSRFAERRF